MTDVCDPLEFETITVEITISDEIATNDTYRHRFVTTETKLEESGMSDLIELETQMALESALQTYLSHRRGKR